MPQTSSIFADDNSSILICLDPGHGGNDHGATGPHGLKEKDVNLDIAFKLRDKLVNAGFKVILTREDDTKKSRDEIVNFANSKNADIFISIHNNSHTSSEKNGTETFYFGQSDSGRLLASYINKRVIERIGTINRGVKAADFFVVRNTKMVSVLVEGAFISNPDEEAKLNDSNFRDKIAEGIYNGILEYLKINANDVLNTKKTVSAQSFVKRVLQKGLNIDPDQSTINSWSAKLAAGTISHADVIKGVILSQQFGARYLTDAQYITVLYNTVLDRNPDTTGSAHWLSQLKLQSREAVLNKFLASAEFLGLVNQYIQNGYSYTGTSNTGNGDTTSETGGVFNLAVLNGVGIKGIAARTSTLFKELKYSNGKDKYNIGIIADAKSYSYKNTQIICKSKNSEILKAAEELKNILKVGAVMTQNGTSQVSDIVLIIGNDYASTTQAVNSVTSYDKTSEQILLNILNGQGSQGIAAMTKNKIESGFNKDKNIIKVTETKNADSFNYKKTKIIIFTSKAGVASVADNLKSFLGAGEISKSTSNAANVDISIILGSDYKK